MKNKINPVVQARIKGYFRQMNVMFVAFIAGLVLFLLTALTVEHYQGPINPEYNTFLTIFAPVSGAALLVLSHRLAQGRIDLARKGEKLHEKMDEYRSAAVLRMILLDGAAFVQVIAFGMTGNKLFVLLCVVILSLFMLYRPGLERLIKDLQLNEVEAEVMRDHAF